MKVYYAHCKAIYGTPQEDRDIALLEKLGYKVFNPNKPIHGMRAKACECSASCDCAMKYFTDLVLDCEALAFRGLPDGKIPSGVYKEVQTALEAGMAVFELPVNPKLRKMTLEETRAYLHEVGER